MNVKGVSSNTKGTKHKIEHQHKRSHVRKKTQLTRHKKKKKLELYNIIAPKKLVNKSGALFCF
jgi:hypothetical protein